MAQGLIQAPVFQGFESASVSFTAHGVAPSVIVVRIHPEDFTPQADPFTVRLTYEGVTRNFPDCILDNGSISFSPSGTRINLRILDHRHRWQFAKEPYTIHANRRVGKEILEETKRTAKELAEDLLKSAGESNHDLDAIPEDWPEVQILGITPPMQELEKLVGIYGLRICYVPQSREVKIVQPGEGAELPKNEWLAFPSVGSDPPERPSKVKLVGGNVQIWATWELEAVGQETEENDFKIVPIDDLSYTPEEGWRKQYPEYMLGVDGQEERTLALKTVYRMYRIKAVDLPEGEDNGDGLAKFLEDVEGLEDADGEPVNPETLGQLLPFLDTIPEVEQLEDGTEQNRKAIVRGEWGRAVIDARPERQNSEEDSVYGGGWSLDGERALLVFSDAVYIYDPEDEDEGPIKPAKMTVELTCHLRVKQDQVLLRGTWDKEVGKRGRGIKVLGRSDLIRVIKYKDEELDDGGEEFETDAKPAVETYIKTLATEKTANGLYNRVEPIDPDGAIQGISYSVGIGGATTQVSRNNESDPVSPSYEVRRRNARANAELDDQ